MRRTRRRARMGSVLSLAWLTLLLATVFAPMGFAPMAQAAPVEEVHSIPFFLHASLIDPGAGRDLAFWQDSLTGFLHQAEIALAGDQGPFDDPCCTRIEQSASLEPFGLVGDGFDVVESAAEFNQIESTFGDGVYIVFSLLACGTSFAASIVGCADTPGDFMVLDVIDTQGNLDLRATGITLAHERGHNAGLQHVFNDACEIMSQASGGGCFSVSECTAMRAKGNEAGDACECLSDAGGTPAVEDGTLCSDVSGCGVCSGGVCGACSSEAQSRLAASGGTESPIVGVPDDFLHLSTLTGGWVEDGPISSGSSVPVEGMAYNAARRVIFAVGPGAGAEDDDRLMELDPQSGELIRVVGSLGMKQVEALAYDPGADVLYAMQIGGEIFAQFPCPADPDCVSTLIEIDPETAAVSVRGPLDEAIIDNGFQGLAYDAASDILYGAAASGLYSIETGPGCNGSGCSSDLFEDGFLITSGLAFESVSGLLFRVGPRGGDAKGRYIAVDPNSPKDMDGIVESLDLLMGIEDFTPGGLTTVPEPPHHALALVAVATLLAARRRSSSQRRGRFR